MDKDENLDRLDIAILEFEDEESGKTFSERLDALREAFMWNAFETIKHIKKYGTKSPISAEHEYKQQEGMKQFKIMEKMYFAGLKSAENKGKSKEEVDVEYLKRIKEKKSTVGEIVRNTK